MFFVKELEYRVTLHPSFFNQGAPQAVIEKLYTDREGKNLGTMMIVAIIDVTDISEPKIVPGTGFADYDISYRAIVWRPFKGEVVDGLVSSVVHNGFFVDVGGLSVFVSKAVCLVCRNAAYVMGVTEFCANENILDDPTAVEVYG